MYVVKGVSVAFLRRILHNLTGVGEIDLIQYIPLSGFGRQISSTWNKSSTHMSF